MQGVHSEQEKTKAQTKKDAEIDGNLKEICLEQLQGGHEQFSPAKSEI